MTLNGEQCRELIEAMGAAFDVADLRQMLRFALGKKLEELVNVSQNERGVLFDLVEFSEKEGWTEALIEAVFAARPGNPEVRAFVENHAPQIAAANAPTRHVDAAKAGLNALTEIVERLADPKIRTIIGRFQAEFEVTHQKIKILGQYKGLHDQLHQVNVKYLRPMASAIGLRQDDTQLQLLESYVLQFQADVARIRGLAKPLPMFQLLENPWIEAFEQAGRQMEQGLNEPADDNLRQGLATVRRVLIEQPTRINAQVWSTAGELRLEGIVKAMREIARRLYAVPGSGEPAAGEAEPERGLPVLQFEAGLNGIVLLLPRLNGLVEEHFEWQLLDKELAAADTVQEVVPERRFARWAEFRARLLTLCGLSPGEEWSKTLGTLLEELQQSGAAQNAVQFGRQYNKFRTVAADRFFNVDAELLDLSDQLAELGEPLDHLLRIVTDDSD